MKNKHYKQDLHLTVVIAVGVGVATIAGLAVTALLAYLVLNGSAQPKLVSAGSGYPHFAACLCGGMAAWLLSGKKNFIAPLLAIAGYILVLIAAHILIIDAQLSVSWTVILAVVTAVCVLLVVQLTTRRGKHFRYKKR